MKPLVIFYGYKEIQNASAQIARTFWEHLPDSEFQPTIVCARKESPFVSSLPLVEIKENRFIHILFGLLRRIGLKDLCMIPDVEYYSWNPFAYRKIKRLIKENHFDYIHTISSPQSTHLLGLKLKKATGLPLVVQCNDPWQDTSGRKYKLKYFSDLDLKYEHKAAIGADLIIHSNNVIADIWNKRYGDLLKDKVKVLPFSFNIWNLPDVKEKTSRSDVLTISHIGNIYSTRSSKTIFNGIELLLREHPEVKGKFKIKYIGGVHQSEKDYVSANKLTEYIDYLGMISPENLSEYYQQSDIFLIIDVIIKRNPNYPSKLMMYYYYQRPIIGLTTPNSNLAEELNSSGHHVCYYEDSKTFSYFLYKAITDYQSLLNFNHNEWKKHTVENVMKLYSEVLTQKLNLKQHE